MLRRRHHNATSKRNPSIRCVTLRICAVIITLGSTWTRRTTTLLIIIWIVEVAGIIRTIPPVVLDLDAGAEDAGVGGGVPATFIVECGFESCGGRIGAVRAWRERVLAAGGAVVVGAEAEVLLDAGIIGDAEVVGFCVILAYLLKRTAHLHLPAVVGVGTGACGIAVGAVAGVNADVAHRHLVGVGCKIEADACLHAPATTLHATGGFAIHGECPKRTLRKLIFHRTDNVQESTWSQFGTTVQNCVLFLSGILMHLMHLDAVLGCGMLTNEVWNYGSFVVPFQVNRSGGL